MRVDPGAVVRPAAVGEADGGFGVRDRDYEGEEGGAGGEGGDGLDGGVEAEAGDEILCC